MKPFRYALSLSLLAVASVSGAKDHPAVEAAKQPSSYDYASKMYRHPAGLNLLAEAPRDLGQHPAILARKKALEAAAAPQLAYHPALLAESGRKLAVSPAINAGLLHPTSTGPSR